MRYALAPLLAATAVAGPPAAPQEICEAIETPEGDLGCSGCTTSVVMDCDDGGADCEPCVYQYLAQVLCYPYVWSEADAGEIEREGKRERRFGGCPGSSTAWGAIECECTPCHDGG